MRPTVRLCLPCPSLQSKARANKWSTYIMLWRQRRGRRWCVSQRVPCRFACPFVCKCQVMVAAVLVTLELKAKCASSPTVFVPAVALFFPSTLLSACSPLSFAPTVASISRYNQNRNDNICWSNTGKFWWSDRAEMSDISCLATPQLCIWVATKWAPFVTACCSQNRLPVDGSDRRQWGVNLLIIIPPGNNRAYLWPNKLFSLYLFIY